MEQIIAKLFGLSVQAKFLFMLEMKMATTLSMSSASPLIFGICSFRRMEELSFLRIVDARKFFAWMKSVQIFFLQK